MKRKKNKPRRQAAGRSMLQIKTTIDFGEEGIPLERLGEITELLKAGHLRARSKVGTGFVPIPFDRYLDLHVRSNPSVDRAEFARRLRKAVDARKAINAGSLFPAFRRLERDGEIACEWRTTENGRRAKYYSLTKRGRQTLAKTTREWQRQTTAISHVLKASPGAL